jgi:Divalent cation transporter
LGIFITCLSRGKNDSDWLSSSRLITISPSFLADFVLVAVILLSNKYKVNPDNMATPLAASIGDVVSISMLSFITSILFARLGKLLMRFNPAVLSLLLSYRGRYSPLDDLCSDWSLLLAATVLDSLSITQPVYTTSIKKWMDPGAFGSVHQRVSFLFRGFWVTSTDKLFLPS